MKNVLVTGGAGFIGSNFIRFLLAKEPEIQIVNLDILTYAGRLENLKNIPNSNHHHFIKGDINNQKMVEELLETYKIDTIVHFAAESHVDRSISSPMPFIQSNIVGTFTLLESARKVWSGKENLYRFHHISTDEVFGALNPGDKPFSELTKYDPHSPYSASKASSDHIAMAYYHTYGLPVTISNCSNNYGPYQFPEKLIPLIICNGIQGKSLPVYGKGAQVRDWLYVEDHCDAIYKILKFGKVGETYCIGGINQPSNLDIVKELCQIMDKKAPLPSKNSHESLITFVKDRPAHDFRYDIDTSKISRELNWHPSTNLDTGLEKTVDWYLMHPEWVDSILNQNDFSSWINTNYQNR